MYSNYLRPHAHRDVNSLSSYTFVNFVFFVFTPVSVKRKIIVSSVHN